MSGSKKIQLIINGKRIDGRGLYDFRKPLKLKVGVISSADGSAYIEWGGNKIIAAVYGPKEVVPRHLENPYRAIIKAYYSMATFCSLEEHGRMGPSRRSVEISKVIRQTLENIVMAELFPKTQIEVYMIVLQAEGGTRVASTVAAVAALMDAGIPLRDRVVALSIGKADGKIVVDVGKMEDNYGEADMPIGLTVNGKEILLLQMDGKMTKEEIKKALDLAFEKAKVLDDLQRKAIEEKYSSAIRKKLEF